MKKSLYILFGILLSILTGGEVYCAKPTNSVQPQKMRGARLSGYEVIEGDTVIQATISPLYVFTAPKDMRQYQRLVKNVKKVYPIAQEAKEYLNELEATLASLKTKREREAFTSQMEKEILKKYTPVLEKMTYSQGKILIKLIDRETDKTPYTLLREFRGRLTAGFYNSIAKIFKADLKSGYDPTKGEDQIIEQIIILYEAGQL